MDPAAVLTTTQIVSGVLDSLKNARDLVRGTNNAELRAQISDAYDTLLDLKAQLLDQDDELRQLKAKLAKQSEIEGPIPPFGYFYKRGDRENPLCPKCYQSPEKREAYLTAPTPWNRGIRRECRICGHLIYEKEMDLSSVRVGRRPSSSWT
jgi:hypothetical protein